MKIGVIGDDFTGSSDIALMLAQGGMKTMQYVRTPSSPATENVDAGIISLKSRSCPTQEAIDDSLSALKWLLDQGCEQIIFKYCSTFDSTPQGNIGPVIDALVDAMGTTDPVIVCPAFPATGRTIYQGHLFVFDQLLSESGMQNHPLTPMTDSDLRRWLSHQTTKSIGHLPLNVLRAGDARQHLLAESEQGRQYVVCDIAADSDLTALAVATKGFKLLTGGSGIALGIPGLYGTQATNDSTWVGENGNSLALSGSCSGTTLSQVALHCENGGSHLSVDIQRLIEGKISAQQVIDWASEQTTLPLVSTSDTPEKVRALQDKYGSERTATIIETFFGDIATLATKQGFSSLICAGGETSGAIVQALNIEALEIGPMIDPGVPALRVSGQPITIALKSGNFGAPDFFAKAQEILGTQP
jgi:uncharacterized protein YgbK (DUF1537 family)